MSEYTRRTRRVGPAIAVALTFAVAACGGGDKSNPLRDSGLASDSALNRDLQLAGGDTTVQPQLQDVPNTPAAQPEPAPAPTTTRTPAPARTTTRPRTTTPKPAPAPPPRTTTTASGNTVTRNTGEEGAAGRNAGGSVGAIAAGSILSLASNGKVCTNTNQVGDVFTAEVTDPVTGSNGATIPRGATVTLRVTSLKRSENVRDPIRMEFDVVSVKINGVSYPLDGEVTSASVTQVSDQPKSKDVQKVVGGAVIGAIAGQVIGKNTKGTVIGAATGAAAGAAVAKATSNTAGCVNQGASMSVKLNSAVQVKV